MRFLGAALILGGYMLVYAATANGGLLATDPWSALWIDAYTQSTDPAVKTRPGETAGVGNG